MCFENSIWIEFRGGIPGLLVQTESSLIMNGLNPPPHQQVTENFMVPDQLVGLIIGKNGEVSDAHVKAGSDILPPPYLAN